MPAGIRLGWALGALCGLLLGPPLWGQPPGQAKDLEEAGLAAETGDTTETAETGPGGVAELPEELARAVRRTTERFGDRSEAIRSGYRRLGPDFPGMGEHWIHPGLMMRGVVDPTRPPLLSYVVRDDHPVLVGLGFALPLAPEEDPPPDPFGREAWHDHSGTVDEEVVLLNHPATVDRSGGGHRLAVVHVWSGLENPDGILVQNNWALPFWRVGLEAPASVSVHAARGLSLAYGGRTYYLELLERATDPSPAERSAYRAALSESASRAEALVERQRSTERPATVDQKALESVWDGFWRRVREGVSEETWAQLSELARTL